MEGCQSVSSLVPAASQSFLQTFGSRHRASRLVRRGWRRAQRRPGAQGQSGGGALESRGAVADGCPGHRDGLDRACCWRCGSGPSGDGLGGHRAGELGGAERPGLSVEPKRGVSFNLQFMFPKQEGICWRLRKMIIRRFTKPPFLVAPRLHRALRRPRAAGHPAGRRPLLAGARRGTNGVRDETLDRGKQSERTNGVSTNGVTANFMFFDRGAFWVLP